MTKKQKRWMWYIIILLAVILIAVYRVEIYDVIYTMFAFLFA